MNIYITLLFLSYALFTVAQQSDTCDRVTRFVNDLGMELNLGPPGKKGPPGPKGAIGNPGNCSCPRTIESLKNRLQSLESS